MQHSSNHSYRRHINMKFLVLLAVLGAAAAAEDQKADDATLISTYAGHPLTYTAGYPYAYSGYHAPTVYSSAYAYNHPLTYSTYNSYTPVVHTLKKRDVSEADQKADDATLVSTYAAHPLTYTAGYPYAYNGYHAPTVYNRAYAYSHPLTYSTYNYSPYVHSLKKRDVSEADQKADDATLISTYAAHPLTYSSALPYAHGYYASPYVYSTPASTKPITYNALPYAYGSYVY